MSGTISKEALLKFLYGHRDNANYGKEAHAYQTVIMAIEQTNLFDAPVHVDMTGTKLTEIREALANVTQGKWYALQKYSNQWSIETSNGIGFIGKSLARVATTTLEVGVADGNEKNNAHLIAKAPEWLQYLLDQNESLQQQVNTLTEMMEKINVATYDDNIPDGVRINRIGRLCDKALQSIKEQTE